MVVKLNANELSQRIQKIFEESQYDDYQNKQLLKELNNIYNNNDPINFEKSFLQCLPLVLSKEKNNLHVDSVLDFISKFICDDGTESKKQLFETILQFVFTKMRSNVVAFRYRASQLLSLIVREMKEMDEDEYEEILKASMNSIKDCSSRVRAQGIKILHRFQDPLNLEHNSTQSIKFHLLYDPSAIVRRESIIHIQRHFKIYQTLINATQDLDENCRIAAFKTLSQIPFKNFNLTNRKLILNNGLKDRSEKVRKFVRTNAIVKWLDTMNYSYIDFANSIKFNCTKQLLQESVDLTKSAFVAFLEKLPTQDIINAIKLNENNLLNDENVSHESILFWCTVAEYLYINKIEDHLNMVLPELVAFCDFIKDLLIKYENNELNGIDKIEEQSIISILFTMTKYFNYSIEAGRRALIKLIDELFSKYNLDFDNFEILQQVLVLAEPSSIKRSNLLEETIIDLFRESKKEKEKNNMEIESFTVEELKYKLNIAKDDKERAVKCQDFNLAAEKRDLEQQLLKQLENIENEENDVEDLNDLYPITNVKNNIDLHFRILDLMISFFHCAKNQCCIDSFIKFKDNYIMKILKLDYPKELIFRVVKMLGIFAILANENGKISLIPLNTLVIAWEKLKFDEKFIKEILQTIFDIIICKFDDMFTLNDSQSIIENSQEEINENTQNNLKRKRALYCETQLDFEDDMEELNSSFATKTNEEHELKLIEIDEKHVEKFYDILLKLLNSENQETKLFALKEIIRLFIGEKIRSKNILIRILMFWFNPNTLEELELRQTLAYALPFIANTVKGAKEMFFQVFFPILEQIRDAPQDDPISEINIDMVIKYLLLYMNPKTEDDINYHDELALKLLEILKNNDDLNDQDDAYNDYLLKTLCQLNISQKDSIRKNLIEIVQDLSEIYSKKYQNLLIRTFTKKMLNKNETTNQNLENNLDTNLEIQSEKTKNSDNELSDTESEKSI